MRDILFRGFATIDELPFPFDNYERINVGGLTLCGKWVYGDLHITNDITMILHRDTNTWIKVNPETVGQSTMVSDTSGKMIFEHDVLRGYKDKEFAVVWHLAGFKATIITEWGIEYCNLYDGETTIIGTIFDT